MSTAPKAPTPYQSLVASIASELDPNYEADPRDIPALTDAQLALVIYDEQYVALDSFSAVRYADILNSAVYLTEYEKALALWRAMRRAAHESAVDHLTADVNDELVKWRIPDGETDMDRAGHQLADFA